MKFFGLIVCLFFTSAVHSQDKLFLHDGTVKTGKVVEIGIENIIYDVNDESFTLSRNEVILIEFKNGTTEIINRPLTNKVISPDGKVEKKNRDDVQKISHSNFISYNSFALCNSDIAVFYEKIMPRKKLGLGFMFAYNFNSSANATNLFIAPLANGKKKYDLGLTANYYFKSNRPDKVWYAGLLFKYTEFSFSRAQEQGTPPNIIINYTADRGSQLCTIITFGTQRMINKSFFIKTIAGLGGFIARGHYKEQLNYYLNKDNKPNDPKLDVNFLPKIYLGLNAGIVF